MSKSNDKITKAVTNNTDKFVAERINKKIRLLKGFSQQQLAEALNVSIQQIQRYEAATNCISTSRL